MELDFIAEIPEKLVRLKSVLDHLNRIDDPATFHGTVEKFSYKIYSGIPLASVGVIDQCTFEDMLDVLRYSDEHSTAVWLVNSFLKGSYSEPPPHLLDWHPCSLIYTEHILSHINIMFFGHCMCYRI